MVWQIRFEDRVKKELAKLDQKSAKRISAFLKNRIATSENPRFIGQPLKGTLREFWRYRIGDYRIICRIEDETLIVLILAVGHRKKI